MVEGKGRGEPSISSLSDKSQLLKIQHASTQKQEQKECKAVFDFFQSFEAPTCADALDLPPNCKGQATKALLSEDWEVAKADAWARMAASTRAIKLLVECMVGIGETTSTRISKKTGNPF
jgi:hypothetical protein